MSHTPRTRRRAELKRRLALTALSLALASLLLAAATGAPALRTVYASTVFVVNSTGDTPDANVGDGLCADSSGACTLRAAIQQANATAGADAINFQIPGPGPHKIAPATPLPPVNDPAAIDGYTQPGASPNTLPVGDDAVLLVELSGENQPAPVLPPDEPPPPPPFGTGLVITPNAGGSSVRGLVINRFAVGIRVLNSNGNTVAGNFIGTDVAGASALPNRNGVVASGSNNVFGGTAPAARNVISGNEGQGLVIQSFITGTGAVPATGNVVQGNYIGTNAAGAAAIPNAANGVLLRGVDNTVGGATPAARNVLSGNGQNGVVVRNFFVFQEDGTFAFNVVSRENKIQGNYAGLNAAGTAAIPNVVDGIRLDQGASENLVGGADPAAGNVVSGNVAHGVHIDDVPFLLEEGGTPIHLQTSGNRVLGNRIGTDASGAAAVGNELGGVAIFAGAQDNVVGGTAPGEGNVIAHSTGGHIDDGMGGSIFVPGAGVTVGDDTPASRRTLRNSIRGNSIHSNQGLGIDLNGSTNGGDPLDGPTPNDACDADEGSNELQNFPVLSAAASCGAGGPTVITGTLDSVPLETYTIDFYASAACDPSGFGEGQVHLGSVSVTAGSDCQAAFTFTATLPPGAQFITATATDADGNTSEFSSCVAAADAPPVITGASATPDSLWPPNHKMVDVTVNYTASDSCCLASTSLSVSSNEPVNGTGDGDTAPDWQVIDAHHVRLRAERAGTGNGRVYTINITATDCHGNTTTVPVTVTVPKSQKK